jgi:hypothetical protein
MVMGIEGDGEEPFLIHDADDLPIGDDGQHRYPRLPKGFSGFAHRVVDVQARTGTNDVADPHNFRSLISPAFAQSDATILRHGKG